MSHYFINDDTLKSKLRTFRYTFRSVTLEFTSDSGVFAKDRVDFGTHVLLQNLPSFTNEQVLDIGCGVGVIGLLIAKAYPKTQTTLSDVNTRALELAQTNIKQSKIVNASVIQSDTYQNITSPYDVILSNPPIRAGKQVVHDIVLGAIDHLNENGIIIVVIQKKQGAESLQKKMEEVYHNVSIIAKEKGYFILKSVKMPS
ncbi:MAG: class I SAM-dependent methyltransferase [Bacilli bacterium]|nr:class I SAM-dependent methyltransferase [Bacilli bacterium]